MRKGRFVVVDGGEGAGKTSALSALRAKYSEDFLVLTREPGGTLFAETIRELIHKPEYKNLSPESFFGLVWSARADHVRNKIAPALERGIHVVSDRFDSSTFAYQICGQGGEHLKKLFWDTREVFLGSIVPDYYILFDVDPKEGIRRVRERNGKKTHFDERALSFHSTVREGFKEFMKKVPHTTIDANQPLNVVQERFFEVLAGLLK